MDFISYLKKIIDEFTGKQEQAQTEKKTETNQGGAETGSNTQSTDTALEEQAKKEYSDWLEKEKNALEDEYGVKQSEVEGKKDSINEDYAFALQGLADSLSKSTEKANNSSIKQGVARSSIAKGKTDAADYDAQREYSKLETNYGRSIDKIDQQIADLEVKFRAAINDLDYDYAKLVEKRVDELKQERDKQSTATETKEQKAERLYNEAAEMLSKMSKNDAKEYVKSKELKDLLEPYYYYKLYKEYS